MSKTEAVDSNPKVRGQIPAPNFKVEEVLIRGNAPYVSNKFSQEAREMMRAKQAAARHKRRTPLAPAMAERRSRTDERCRVPNETESAT